MLPLCLLNGWDCLDLILISLCLSNDMSVISTTVELDWIWPSCVRCGQCDAMVNHAKKLMYTSTSSWLNCKQHWAIAYLWIRLNGIKFCHHTACHLGSLYVIYSHMETFEESQNCLLIHFCQAYKLPALPQSISMIIDIKSEDIPLCLKCQSIQNGGIESLKKMPIVACGIWWSPWKK